MGSGTRCPQLIPVSGRELAHRPFGYSIVKEHSRNTGRNRLPRAAYPQGSPVHLRSRGGTPYRNPPQGVVLKARRCPAVVSGAATRPLIPARRGCSAQQGPTPSRKLLKLYCVQHYNRRQGRPVFLNDFPIKSRLSVKAD